MQRALIIGVALIAAIEVAQAGEPVIITLSCDGKATEQRANAPNPSQLAKWA